MLRFILLLCVIATTQAAFAIYVPLPSAGHVPFSITYPEHARHQVRTALETRNCKFIAGYSVNAVSTLHFSGDTTAMNEMLKNLSDSPAAIVSVSFQKLDHPCDWKITHNTSAMTFQVAVNLNSKQIKLEQLTIPHATGPELNH